MLKKLFGGIDLNWKKLLIFAVTIGIYTGIMALLPFTKDTSFRDIAGSLEWWVLFGIIIITNSKSPTDSALKCFVFFLISQPLVYLVQAPFSPMGFGLFNYYTYRFILTLFTLPMGYIGYYIKKGNIWSFLILTPILIVLTDEGLSLLRGVINNFHFLTFVFCFFEILILIMNIFDKRKWRILSFAVVGTFAAIDIYLTFFGPLKGYIYLI